MNEHTPGPWRKSGLYDGHVAALLPDGQERLIAILLYSGTGPRQVHANGLLMAAAPDLLAACEQALATLDWSEHGELQATLASAIALAKDGQGDIDDQNNSHARV